jgi:AraC-like DNA-binding protein
MNQPKLRYEDLLSVAEPDPAATPLDEFRRWTATNQEWGNYQERNYADKHVRINAIETDFNEDLAVSVLDENLPESVNICMPLMGSVSTNISAVGLFTDLRANRHHHVYAPAIEYELEISRKTHLVHIAVEKGYYTRLLSDQERWSATLREKLLNNESTHSGEREGGPAMQTVLHQLLTSPLSGNLGRIFREAKVLELIALQLNYLCTTGSRIDEGLSKKDREVLEGVHDYLTYHFREEQSLQRLSKTFGLNEFKLKKGFKNLFGKTIFDYIFELKMSYARQLLLDSDKLVCEVSRDVGYKNPNHFSTAFKKQFGVNPVLLRQ